jgi:hypothetical protein
MESKLHLKTLRQHEALQATQWCGLGSVQYSAQDRYQQGYRQVLLMNRAYRKKGTAAALMSFFPY